MWNVRGKPVAATWLNLQPVRVLYSYDGPRTFTCKDAGGNLYLAHWCDEDGTATRYLLVAFSESLLEQLTTGQINVRDALSRPKAWLVDVDSDWTPVLAWEIDVDDLPAGTLPETGVMLWRHLDPVVNRISTT